jgi:cytoskeletal protein CcmA (bactofilin family)
VFRGFFGSKDNQSPSPPKNQIEVVCPACGAAQYEPRLVVSTFCKRCGVHLTVEKRRVTASEVSKAGGRPEVLGPSVKPEPAAQPASSPPRQPISAPRAAAISGPLASLGSTRPAEPKTFTPDLSETGELGLGMMLQAVSTGASLENASSAEPAPAAVESESDAPEKAPPGDEAEARQVDEPLPVTALMQRGPSVAENPGTLQKMKDQGFYRQQYFKEAQCFDCDHKFKVGRSSRSANCPSCGAYISLEDIELNMPSSQAIKTRGDVLIRKRGQLSATHLFARELRCYGSISANMNCSGDAIFRTSGTIVGEVHCRRFIVEKGSEIVFMNSIYADEVEIHASITGNVFSKGPLLISANGAVNGDVTARSVSIEPGGELNGAMNIVRIAAAPAPTSPPGT